MNSAHSSANTSNGFSGRNPPKSSQNPVEAAVEVAALASGAAASAGALSKAEGFCGQGSWFRVDRVEYLG